MTYDEAYALMEEGKAISLPELIPYNVFYYLSGGFEISRDKISNPTCRAYFTDNPKYINTLDTTVTIEPHIDMKSETGSLVIGVDIPLYNRLRTDWIEFDVLK